MSYQDNEISTQDGNIVSLYEFKWGETYWRYSSADVDITILQNFEEKVYTAVAIGDNGMKQGGSSNNTLEVDVQSDIPLVGLFNGTPPAGSIWLTVRRKHLQDFDDDWFVHWIGTVGNVKKNDIASATIICRTILATYQRSGLRLAWTRGCPHLLYDSECRANRDTFAVAAVITSVNSDGTITVSTSGGNPQGWFDGGYFEWEATVDGTLDQRGISSSVDATTFKIFGSNSRLENGMAITLYPGCDLTAPTCHNKFSNLDNFGGFEQMAGNSPFDGKNVF